MKVTAQLYGQFLVSSQVNYTGTYLADHLDGLTHDNVGYFLKTSHFTPRQLWQQVRPQVVLSARGYVLFDDTVLDKHHSRRIELVRRQYSGNAHGVIAGIGLVNCVYVNPDTDQFWLIDYRLFAPDVDGKTKLDHVADMLGQLAPRGVAYRTVLMDSWYATTALFKWLLAAGKTFYCPLKSNRLVDDSGDQQPDQPVGCLCWSNEEVAQGKILKVKWMPKKLFELAELQGSANVNYCNPG
ncbi:transposase, partial [Hymenobacter frigidus]|uniref:transposase n=1 Tax=Hymenobacter frigidus TaxID=1524095 RepID=UPI00166EC4C5